MSLSTKIDPRDLTLQYSELSNGVAMLCGYVADYVYPVGTMWFSVIDFSGAVEIGYVLTHHEVRRRGIATALLHELRQRHPGRPIRTDSGNEYSTGWLMVSGFVRVKNGWLLE